VTPVTAPHGSALHGGARQPTDPPTEAAMQNINGEIELLDLDLLDADDLEDLELDALDWQDGLQNADW
jgi:hypothetical protein